MALPLTLAGSDPDGDALTFEIVDGVAHGSLSGTGAARTYTPAPDYHGLDSFTFRTRDGVLDSTLATVSLTVRPVNDAPEADDRFAGVTEDVPRALTLTGSDVDGDALGFTIVGPPAHGSLTGTGASRTYTPDPNFHGLDSFTYRANDGALDSDLATFSLIVTAGERRADGGGPVGGDGRGRAAAAHAGGRRRGRGRADLHDRGRARARLADRDGYGTDVHAGAGLPRPRLVHLPDARRRARLESRDRLADGAAGQRRAHGGGAVCGDGRGHAALALRWRAPTWTATR